MQLLEQQNPRQEVSQRIKTLKCSHGLHKNHKKNNTTQHKKEPQNKVNRQKSSLTQTQANAKREKKTNQKPRNK
jgi:hypothetical protein